MRKLPSKTNSRTVPGAVYKAAVLLEKGERRYRALVRALHNLVEGPPQQGPPEDEADLLTHQIWEAAEAAGLNLEQEWEQFNPDAEGRRAFVAGLLQIARKYGVRESVREAWAQKRVTSEERDVCSRFAEEYFHGSTVSPETLEDLAVCIYDVFYDVFGDSPQKEATSTSLQYPQSIVGGCSLGDWEAFASKLTENRERHTKDREKWREFQAFMEPVLAPKRLEIRRQIFARQEEEHYEESSLALETLPQTPLISQNEDTEHFRSMVQWWHRAFRWLFFVVGLFAFFLWHEPMTLMLAGVIFISMRAIGDRHTARLQLEAAETQTLEASSK